MSELVDFLTARLDEDEAVALDAALEAGDEGFGDERRARGGRWGASYHKVCLARAEGKPRREILEGRALGLDVALHVARHDPARVLREVTAKRTILADHCLYESANPRQLSIFGERVVRALALPFSDHPDFQEQWR